MLPNDIDTDTDVLDTDTQDTQDHTPSDGEQPAASEQDDNPYAAMRGAPEDGLYDLTLDDETAAVFGPNGEDLNFDGFDRFSQLAAEMDLSQAAVDKLMGVYAGKQAEYARQNAAHVQEMLEGWVETAKNDPEIGGFNWDSSVESANRVIQAFGTPELVSQVLLGQGLGNHPEFIRFFSRIGKAMGASELQEPAPYNGPAPATDRDDLASSMYSATTPSEKKA